MSAIEREDPELGPVRFCHGCAEWWPLDDEFWYLRDGKLNKNYPFRCRACCLDYYAERRRVAQVIQRRNQRIPEPVEGRCNRVMLTGRCGRFANHENGCRTMAAMRSDAERPRVRGAKPARTMMAGVG